MATSKGRGKAPSKNTPSKGTPADQRKAGRGAKPGPTKGSHNK